MAESKRMTRDGEISVVEPPRSLIAALHRLLRPLVSALVRQQVQYPQLARLLKSLYIDVAQNEFTLGRKGTTLSRLSLLTGITRREAKRISEAAMLGDAPPPRSIGLGAQILARWTADAPYIDSEGRPRPLSRSDGGKGGFLALVRSVSTDMHPRSVLDEWLRLGVAKLDEEDRVVLNTAGFVPASSYDEKAHYVGRNLRDHISAGFENIVAEQAPHFERAVYYGELPEEAVVELEGLARKLGQETLERVNARARELKQSALEAPSEEPGRRFTFGVYCFNTAVTPEDQSAEPGEPNNPAEQADPSLKEESSG